MTRKDFEAVARAMKASRPKGGDERKLDQWNETFYSMVSEVEKTNANFNYDRFAAACGKG